MIRFGQASLPAVAAAQSDSRANIRGSEEIS
jgi:hypothetical protein